jgi:murein DD-endopeptidase MepM/ murein hydrolase activator NlpD
MAIDPTTPVLGPNGLPKAAPGADVDRQEIKRLAQQFESMLLTQMMREMRRSMLDDEDDQGGLGMNAMVDTGDIAFGDALSRNGGLGFTSQMLAAFERQVQAFGASGAPAAMAGSVTRAVEAPMFELPSAATPMAFPLNAPPVALPPGDSHGPGAALDDATGLSSLDSDRDALSEVGRARVSSAFGWRRDPLTGAAKFHAGVDLAVAYGRDVKAAAQGVVAFAGTQNGYGTTVVIDHGAGRQTRYAHLSDSLVQAGDRVAEGQVVGKSGNSGRSTGPHLHFEMLVNGQAVDPTKGRL